jgi:hypothetical protein
MYIHITLFHLPNDLVSFVYRQQPTAADKEAWEVVKANVPSAATHPNTFAWFVLVNRFSDAARNSWAAAQAAAPAKGGKAAPAKKEDTKKEEPKKEEPKKEAKPADDDMDLFGSDDEDDAVCLSMYLIVIINRLPRRLLRRLKRPTRLRLPSPSPLPSPSSSSR